MTRTLLLTTLLLTAACTTSLPPTTYYPSASDQDVIGDTVEAWEAAGLPDVDEDACRLEHVQVSVASDQRFRELCVACGPGHCPGYRASLECRWGCAHECARYMRVSFANGRWPIVIVHERSPYADDMGAAIAHGLWHLLGASECTGAGLDRLHGDARRW